MQEVETECRRVSPNEGQLAGMGAVPAQTQPLIDSV